MREDYTVRTAALIGAEGVKRLERAKVLVCGIGGVGGYAVEALARAGVGRLGLLDGDVVSATDLNRQIIATTRTLGRKKTEVAAERVREINPDCECVTYDMFYLPQNADALNLAEYDWVIDAVDTVAAKVELIRRAKAANVKIVSSMGTGNKLNPVFEICELKKTKVCPLAKVMRKLLKERGVTDVPVLYSEEEPRRTDGERTPSSISYVPAVAGLTLAGFVIRQIVGV